MSTITSSSEGLLSAVSTRLTKSGGELFLKEGEEKKTEGREGREGEGERGERERGREEEDREERVGGEGGEGEILMRTK